MTELDHETARKYVTDALAGELSEEKSRQLQAFLEEHPDFREEVRELKETWKQDLEPLEDLGELESPPSMNEELRGKLKANLMGSGEDQPSADHDTGPSNVPGKRTSSAAGKGPGGPRGSSRRGPIRSSSGSWKGLFAAAAAVLLLVAGYVLLNRQDQPQQENWIATLRQPAENVRVRRNEKPVPIEQQTRLYPRDRLFIPENGTATLSYRDGKAEIELTGKAKAELHEENQTKRISLDAGTLDGQVHEEPKNKTVVIVTPHARAEIVGTEFTLRTGKTTQLSMRSGKLRFSATNADTSVVVSKGEYAEVGADGAIEHGRKQLKRDPYYILDLSDAFTASTKNGNYHSKEVTRESVQFTRYGIVTYEGVPYRVVKPGETPSGNNIIVLKGGNGYAKTMPQEVTVAVPVKDPISKIHFLSGVAGWGYPIGDEEQHNSNAMQAIVSGPDGRESITMKNNREFADYIKRVDVPGSTYAENLTRNSQIRYFTKELEKPRRVDEITLRSFDNELAPTVASITVERASTNPSDAENGK